METKEHLVRRLILQRYLQEFEDIFQWYSPSRLARHLGKNSSRMKDYIADPGKFTVYELMVMADVFGVELKDIIRLVFAQVLSDDRYSHFKCIQLRNGL